MTDRPYHGGDLSEARARFLDAPEPWLDLSTGINPWPYPVGELAGEAWTRLPDAALMGRLAAAAAGYYGAGEGAMAVPAPGSQALLQWLPRVGPEGPVAVLVPTYAEHAHTWGATGREILFVHSPEELATAEASVLVVVNPNNPTGVLYSREYLLALVERMTARGGWLVVDEAFGDLVPDNSMAPFAGRPGLVVLRSFGKFFGLAGARLGFAIASAETGAALASALGPWAVSGPAAHAAVRALADEEWIDETRKRLGAHARALNDLLANVGFQVLGGTDLFRLVATANAPQIFDALLQRGIYVRRFPRRPQWLRFGLPDEAGLDRLAAAFGDITGDG